MVAPKEVLPERGDISVVQVHARPGPRGHFKGHTGSASRHDVPDHEHVDKVPNKEDAGIGMVMAGRTGLDNIAAHTALGKRSVKRALRWLEEEGWIETERTYTPTGREDRRYILVLLDSRSHTERQRRYDVEVAIGKIMEEGSQSDHQGGRQSDHPRGSQSDHP